MTKNLKKFTAEQKFIFFDQKLQFTYLQAFIKDVQATGEVFIPQKRTSSTSKLEFSSLLWAMLALPDPYSQCGYRSESSRPKRMQIHNTGFETRIHALDETNFY
jgi:hypothetical protein